MSRRRSRAVWSMSTNHWLARPPRAAVTCSVQISAYQSTAADHAASAPGRLLLTQQLSRTNRLNIQEMLDAVANEGRRSEPDYEGRLQRSVQLRHMRHHCARLERRTCTCESLRYSNDQRFILRSAATTRLSEPFASTALPSVLSAVLLRPPGTLCQEQLMTATH